MIQGQPRYGVPGEPDTKTLKPGSYFSSEGEAAHPLSCETDKHCIIYVRTKGRFDVTAEQPD